MAGEFVPLVLLPRFSAFSGTGTYTTIGMDVSDYSGAVVNVWRGVATGFLGATLEESSDKEEQNWTACSGGTVDYDPGLDTEGQLTVAIQKRWLRIKVRLGSSGIVTCWAAGFLVRRES